MEADATEKMRRDEPPAYAVEHGRRRRRRSARPSRKHRHVRGVTARSMPEGPARRGVGANRARIHASAREAESIDGAERRESIDAVMAGRTLHGTCFPAVRSADSDFQLDTVSGGRFSIFTSAGQRALARSGFKKSLAPNHMSGDTSPCAIACANESAVALMSEQTKW